MKTNVLIAKSQFNKFFQRDLYGQYDNAENIILSRGSWNDDTLALPKLFNFCTTYTLTHRWVGYSDSLGHDNVYRSLVKRFNLDTPTQNYTESSFALTMGNVATMGFVYKRLGKIIPKDKIVVATVPYYPSIIKTISDIFPNLKFVSSLLEENEIKDKILAIISSQDSVGIIHLTNFIGVEGRVYSTEFFKEIASEAYRKNIFIVIDEGLWYDQLIYPDEIALPNVIRLVSPSKKYGIPGMKLGFLIADPEFIASYYEEASSGYGGPASMFFLLLEFLMLFEYVYITGDKSVFSQITNSYPDIDKAILADLFEDYCGCISQNHSLYRENKKVLEKWLAQNTFVKEAYILNGLNFFVRIESRQPSMYAFFEELIKNEGVSVMPSSCFGDINDQYVRISILEDKISLKNGLDSITRYLNSEAETPREASRPMREQSYTLM